MSKQSSIAGLVAAATLTGTIAGVIGIIGGFPAFEGADAGTPIPFDAVVLPPVGGAGGPQAGALDTRIAMGSTAVMRDAASPFQPTFDQLVNGETVLTTDAQMRLVWDTLFDAPYPAQSFDFQNEFAVLMGGGAMHPWFGFEIAAVDQFDATWSDGGPFPTTYVEPSLAVAAVTMLPGVEPEPMDPEFKVSLVTIDRAFLGDILFNRQVFAAP